MLEADLEAPNLLCLVGTEKLHITKKGGNQSSELYHFFADLFFFFCSLSLSLFDPKYFLKYILFSVLSVTLHSYIFGSQRNERPQNVQ